MEARTKNLVLTAQFVALSFVGASVKMFGTIAFDSLPGFLAALLMGPSYGALIGFLGHLLTALTSGFPLSVPVHIAVAVSMAATMAGFGWVNRLLADKAPETVRLIAVFLVGVILNGPVSLIITMGVVALTAGRNAALGLWLMLPALAAGAAANILLGIILYKTLERVWRKI